MKVIYNEEKAILKKEEIDKETAEENERILKRRKRMAVASIVTVGTVAIICVVYVFSRGMDFITTFGIATICLVVAILLMVVIAAVYVTWEAKE